MLGILGVEVVTVLLAFHAHCRNRPSSSSFCTGVAEGMRMSPFGTYRLQTAARQAARPSEKVRRTPAGNERQRE